MMGGPFQILADLFVSEYLVPINSKMRKVHKPFHHASFFQQYYVKN